MLDSEHILEALPSIILMLPLFGFVVLALFGDAIKRDHEQKGATILACAVVLLAFGLTVTTAVMWWEWRQAQPMSAGLTVDGATDEAGLHTGTRVDRTPHALKPLLAGQEYFIEVPGALYVSFTLLIDPLSLVMMLVITGIGSLIHIYSLGYMSHDEERVRYFSYLNLFTFFMLLLVMGSSLPLLFIGWEGVGLCSYLLIGFWFKKRSATDAGNKAFIVNRIGDAGLILAMALTFAQFGTFELTDIVNIALNPIPEEAAWAVTAIALLLFLGACGKSAQIPLHVWLPDAMEGPTPVSALIHAATMVTAGVYMVCRLGPLYHRSATALLVVAVVGTATALMAATVALVQTDIKKVLAYSTVSQLGYMFIAAGVGAFGVAVFHLFTHAFFKALLFLGSGSVIHALSGEQDMRQMGGLRKKIPWTYWTFLIGTLAIAGIPPLAGFFSKDAILLAAWQKEEYLLFGIGLLTALLTAFYMSRMLFLTFFGSYRGTLEKEHAHAPAPVHAPADDHGHGHGHGGIHESPASMLVPLVLLALGSIVVGFVPIEEILAPVFRVVAHEGEHPHWLPVLATVTALAGIALAWYFYLVRTDLPKRFGETFDFLQRIFEAKWGFDDAYNAFVRKVVVGGSERVLWKGLDASVIDGAVNGTAAITARVADAARFVQTGLVRAYALMILCGAVALLSYLLWLSR